MSAATQARKRRGAEALEIVAFERGRHTSYSACGIPYWIGGAGRARSDAAGRAHRRSSSARNDIDVRTAAPRWSGIDLDAGTVTRPRPRRAAASTREASTSSSTPPARSRSGRRCRASTRRACTACRPSTTARRSGPRSPRTSVRRAVVVGGGYIGLEMAEALVRRGLEVTVVEPSPQPMSHARPRHRRVRRGRRPRPGHRLVLGDGRSPRSRPAPAAGRPACVTARAGAARRPRRARAGRAAQHRAGPGGRDPDRRRPAASSTDHADAHRGARRRLGRRRLRARRSTGCPASAVVRRARHARQQAGPGGGHQHRRRVRHVPRRDRHGGHQGLRPRGGPHRAVARPRPSAAGLRASSPRWSSRRPGPATSPAPARSRSSWSPRSGTGRLLGAQIVGREGAAKRIDVLATAIWNEMTVDEVSRSTCRTRRRSRRCGTRC